MAPEWLLKIQRKERNDHHLDNLERKKTARDPEQVFNEIRARTDASASQPQLPGLSHVTITVYDANNDVEKPKRKTTPAVNSEPQKRTKNSTPSRFRKWKGRIPATEEQKKKTWNDWKLYGKLVEE